MVIFAFVNGGKASGYYIAADRAAMGWRGLPHDLVREMEDVKRKGEEVQEVSIGLDADWFLRTNARHACKTEYSRPDLISNVDQFLRLIKEADLSLTDYAIQFFTFVPDPTGYVTVLHKTDGSLTRCAWHNVPRELDALLEREAPKGVRHVTVGVNGSYVLVLNTGVVWWEVNVPVRLHQLLEDAEKRRRSVATVSLSLTSRDWYFIEFVDGATDFCLPKDWNNSIIDYTAQAMRVRSQRVTTAYNSGAPVRAHTYPQHAQFGLLNPVHSYGVVANPGYTPFASNPQLAWAFTQQPVYNITHVLYSTPVPQPEQQQQQQQHGSSSLQKYNGMFTLLDGALKLAGAALGPKDSGSGYSF